MRKSVLIVLAAAAIAVGLGWALRPSAEPDRTGAMRGFVETWALEQTRGGLADSALTGLTARFYEARRFAPAWTGSRKPADWAESAVELIERAHEDGLDPQDYGATDLRRRLENGFPDENARFSFDADLSRAVLLYARHMIQGRVDPAATETPWATQPREIDAAAVLATHHDELSGVPAVLRPSRPGYEKLRAELARYREIVRAGGWPAVPYGPSLRAGDPADPALIASLRARLGAEGFIGRDRARGAAAGGGAPAADSTFADDLAGAVWTFQSLRGIVPDSILGTETVEALNVSAEARVRQIEMNLERHRWTTDRIAERRIEVNVPSFELWAREGDRAALHMPVIVGKPDWGSPVLTDEMDHVVLNPYWNVPESIVAEEIVPAVLEDRSYIEEHDLEVLSPDGATMIDPRDVDWASIDPRSVLVRQRPGPANPLGRIKFMFPNRFNVYLHDTPTQPLFERTDRAFSHGCIRVGDPDALADWVMQGDGSWRERLRQAVEDEKDLALKLPERIPVHITYWTAFVDDGNRLQFHQDIYGIDAALDRAFARRSARAGTADGAAALRP